MTAPGAAVALERAEGSRGEPQAARPERVEGLTRTRGACDGPNGAASGRRPGPALRPSRRRLPHAFTARSR